VLRFSRHQAKDRDMVTNLTVLDGNTFFDSDPAGDVEPG
jgi:hypothetical protein